MKSVKIAASLVLILTLVSLGIAANSQSSNEMQQQDVTPEIQDTQEQLVFEGTTKFNKRVRFASKVQIDGDIEVNGVLYGKPSPLLPMGIYEITGNEPDHPDAQKSESAE